MELRWRIVNRDRILSFSLALSLVLHVSCGGISTDSESQEVREYVDAVATAIAEGGPLPTPHETVSPGKRRLSFRDEAIDPLINEETEKMIGSLIENSGPALGLPELSGDGEEYFPASVEGLLEKLGMTMEEFQALLERNEMNYVDLLEEARLQEKPADVIVKSLIEIDGATGLKPWRDDTCGFWIPPSAGGPPVPEGFLVVSVTGENLGPLGKTRWSVPLASAVEVKAVESLELLCRRSVPTAEETQALFATLAQMTSPPNAWCFGRWRYALEEYLTEEHRAHGDQNVLLYDLGLVRTQKSRGMEMTVVDIYLRSIRKKLQFPQIIPERQFREHSPDAP